MSNFLKKLAKDWREAGDSPTLANHQRVKSAYYRCASELEAMVGAVEALGKFIPGSGVGLPHGTVAWVVSDGKRYIREWHPMAPDDNGKPLGNWWSLEGFALAGAPRFNESEVTHYSIIEVPPMPNGKKPQRPTPAAVPAQVLEVVVGQLPNETYFASTTLVQPSSGQPIVVSHVAATEEEAVADVRERADAVLKTFFTSYKIVRT